MSTEDIVEEIVDKNEFDFNSALSALSDLVDTYSSDVYIPSTKSDLKLREINANQQKELIGSSVDNSLYNTVFIISFYKILVELLGDEILKTLTVFDKASLVLGVRKQISDVLMVRFDEKSEESSKISLDIILKQIKKNYQHPKPTKLGDKKLSVTVSTPSIYTEFLYEDLMHKKEKTVNDIKTSQDVKDIISKEFLGEISKYVKLVSMGKDHIDFDTLTFPQKIRLVEKLPSSIVQEILSKISDWKKDLESYLIVSDDSGKQVTIKIDPILFVN